MIFKSRFKLAGEKNQWTSIKVSWDNTVWETERKTEWWKINRASQIYKKSSNIWHICNGIPRSKGREKREEIVFEKKKSETFQT